MPPQAVNPNDDASQVLARYHDVAVIGAGLIGLSWTALLLAKDARAIESWRGSAPTGLVAAAVLDSPNLVAYFAGKKIDIKMSGTDTELDKNVIEKLNAAMEKTLSDPTIVKRWAAEGVSTFPENQRSLVAAAAFMKSEIGRWGEVIRDNNIHVNQ